MPECPRCHVTNLVKTIFGSYKCPQCLYQGGKINPLKPGRKTRRTHFNTRAKYGSKSQWYGEGPKRKHTRKARVMREQEADSVYHQYLQKDIVELIEIVSLKDKRRSERLTAIQALGEKGDLESIELLSSFLDHPDMDVRRFAREAIESINSQKMKQNIMQSRPSAEKIE